MRQNNLDLLLALMIAAVSVILAFLPNHPLFIGILCALPLVFVIPGYTIVEALFIRPADPNTSLILKADLKIYRPFNRYDRITLSLGLSLAMVIVTGFILNMLPAGLEQKSWFVSLSTLSSAFSFMALYRRRRAKISISGSAGNAYRFRLSLYDFTLFILAIIIMVSSVWYSLINAQQQQQQSTFTQFWMTPSKQAHNSCAVLVGMQSFEVTSIMYDVVVIANGTKISSWSDVVLAPRSQWYQSVTIQPRKNVNMIYIEAKLYRTDKIGIVYRDVHIVLNSSQGGNGRILAC